MDGREGENVNRERGRLGADDRDADNMTGEGYAGYELVRRDQEETVEYVTITRFDSWEALEAFAGEDYEQAHVPSEARALLTDFDERAHHYEVRSGDRPSPTSG